MLRSLHVEVIVSDVPMFPAVNENKSNLMSVIATSVLLISFFSPTGTNNILFDTKENAFLSRNLDQRLVKKLGPTTNFTVYVKLFSSIYGKSVSSSLSLMREREKAQI